MSRSQQSEARAAHFCDCLEGLQIGGERFAVRQVYSCCNLHTDWVCPCKSHPQDQCPRGCSDGRIAVKDEADHVLRLLTLSPMGPTEIFRLDACRLSSRDKVSRALVPLVSRGLAVRNAKGKYSLPEEEAETLWPNVTPQLKEHVSACLLNAQNEALQGRSEGAKAFLANANRYLPKDHPLMLATQTLIGGFGEVSR